MEKISDCWQTPEWLFDDLNEEFNFDIDLCATEDNSKCSLYGADYLINEFSDKHYNNVKTETFKLFCDTYQISVAFCNPPYSNPKPFIEKAWEDSQFCQIVCLVKCDPSTRWWSTFWNYEDVEEDRVCHICKGKGLNSFNNEVECRFCTQGKQWFLKEDRGPKPGCEVRFFPKRIKFDPPEGLNLDCECVEKLHKDFSLRLRVYEQGLKCTKCKGAGKKVFSGPTFPCALVIMDRRSL